MGILGLVSIGIIIDYNLIRVISMILVIFISSVIVLD
jgi:hypothetical protein